MSAKSARLTGQINDVGNSVRVNVQLPRLGSNWKVLWWCKRFHEMGRATFGQNTSGISQAISSNYDAFGGYNTIDHGKSDISFSQT